MTNAHRWEAALTSRWRRLEQWQREQENRWRLDRGKPIEVHGLLIRTGPETSPHILEHLIRGSYERQEAEGLRSLLVPSDRVLEFGSGLGVIACIAGRSASKVLSFEANPRLVERAEANLALNGIRNVAVRSGVVGRQAGTATFRVEADFWSSSLGTARAGEDSIEVEVHALSAVLETFRPTVVVMDIEGGEYELLGDPAWMACASLRGALVELHDVGGDALDRLLAPWTADRPVEAIRAEFARVGNCTVSLKRIT